MIFYSKSTNLNIKNSIGFISFKNLEKFKNITHGVSTRLGGISTGKFKGLNLGMKSGDNIQNINLNYDFFCQSVGINRNFIISCNQVHSNNIQIITKELNTINQKTEFDGLITDQPNVALATFHADCSPIFVYDNIKKVIGLAHAGWRGTLNNIAGKMINYFKIHFKSDPKNLTCGIGPAINICCLKVDSDVADLFFDLFKNNKNNIQENNIIYKSNNKYHLNILEINKLNILNAGVPEENISICELCTCCNNDLFFSRRASQSGYGTMMAIIMLNPKFPN
ncbi:MAG: peptidoglycan editing factor PgeF [Candidatus Improbicoccus devescovinae]|nr:MAG: peptidoglycan editing factor PgeF [Candidatus Improbicoccus devescovinae]